MPDIDKPDDTPSETPEPTPSDALPQCSIEISEPFEFDGRRVRSVLAMHSDGFVCLHFDDAEKTDTSSGFYNGGESDLSF